MVRKKDWENFVSEGRAPHNIRAEILESWERSVQHNVLGTRRAPLLREEEFTHQRALAHRLRTAAQTALKRAEELLNGSNSILLLCDDRGLVLDAVGDACTLARARENHLQEGGRWTEADIGTNAIGTALHLGHSILVRETEHYCETIQRWNCAATPISDPGTDSILGILDISWPRGSDQAGAIALSAALALQVETELARQISYERELLMGQIYFRRLRKGSEPLLIMDRSGTNFFSTDDFLRFHDDDASLGLLRQSIRNLIDRAPDKIVEDLSDRMQGMDLEVITNQNKAIGVLVSVRQQHAMKPCSGTKLAQIGRVGSVTAHLCERIQKLGNTRLPILLEGETGVGKTYLAKVIHRASLQCEGFFEIIDCAQLSEDKLRNDLDANRIGPSGGVLCLNSPDNASLPVQKLLLTLVERSAQEGSRTIALSTRSLYDEVRNESFQSDLYYRIAGTRLYIPPLRERPEEIIPLLRQLGERHAKQNGKRELRFTLEAINILKRYAWPGNLHEMLNLIVALDALSPTGLIDERALPAEFRQRPRNQNLNTLRDAERAKILEAIDAEGGNLSKAACRLAIARSTLYLKLDSYGISRKRDPK